jgi:hypothetical protein
VIGLRVTLWMLGLGIRLLQYELGRRLVAGLVLGALCSGLAVLVFTYPEPSGSAAAPRIAQPRTATPTTTKPLAAGQVPRPAKSPEEAAMAWYARRHRLARGRVRVLQRDLVSPELVHVVVFADPGNGRLDTAVVAVRRTSAGWRVQP